MDRTERFYKIDQLLRERGCVPRRVLLTELEVSAATFKRDLEYMRERLHAPIVWDAERGGYRLADGGKSGPRYELPGLWFNPGEVHALLTMQHLLSNLEPGLLSGHVEPLMARLRALLGSGDHSAEEIEKRVRILHMAARRGELKHFEAIGSALLARRRLRIAHYNRQRDETTEREVSPQRLVHYRDNWYLDAWCHRVDAIRSFALDAIRKAEALDKRAKDVPAAELDEHVKGGYGIFSGRNLKWAKLRFTPERARWVSAERWHEKQKSRFEPDGAYLLEVPYADDRELAMDILKYGPDCEVLAPAELRERIAGLLAAAARRYR